MAKKAKAPAAAASRPGTPMPARVQEGKECRPVAVSPIHCVSLAPGNANFFLFDRTYLAGLLAKTWCGQWNI